MRWRGVTHNAVINSSGAAGRELSKRPDRCAPRSIDACGPRGLPARAAGVGVPRRRGGRAFPRTGQSSGRQVATPRPRPARTGAAPPFSTAGGARVPAPVPARPVPRAGTPPVIHAGGLNSAAAAVERGSSAVVQRPGPGPAPRPRPRLPTQAARRVRPRSRRRPAACFSGPRAPRRACVRLCWGGSAAPLPPRSTAADATAPCSRSALATSSAVSAASSAASAWNAPTTRRSSEVVKRPESFTKRRSSSSAPKSRRMSRTRASAKVTFARPSASSSAAGA